MDDIDKDPDMSKRPTCAKCGRKAWPYMFASAAWHLVHKREDYCQRGHFTNFPDMPPYCELDCAGNEIQMRIT